VLNVIKAKQNKTNNQTPSSKDEYASVDMIWTEEAKKEPKLFL